MVKNTEKWSSKNKLTSKDDIWGGVPQQIPRWQTFLSNLFKSTVGACKCNCFTWEKHTWCKLQLTGKARKTRESRTLFKYHYTILFKLQTGTYYSYQVGNEVKP